MSGFNFTVKGSMDLVLRDIRHVSNLQKQVAASSVNEIARDIKRIGSKRLATLKALPQKAVKSRVILSKATRRIPRARIFVLQQGVLVSDLKHRVTKRKGVTAGKNRFPKGFEATTKSGHTDLFQRRGRRRLPIDKLKVELRPEAAAIFGPLVRSESRKFPSVFNRRMKKRLARA